MLSEWWEVFLGEVKYFTNIPIFEGGIAASKSMI